MNMEVRQPMRAQKTRYGIVDCDIHPKLLLEDMRPDLANQLLALLRTYGLRTSHGIDYNFQMTSRTLNAPRRRGARPAALLDDLRGRGRSRPADRHPRVRLFGLGVDELGLALVLHRGDDRACDRPGRGRRQHDLRRIVRAVPRPEGRADRVRLRLASGIGLAARQALGAHARRGPACEAP